MSELDEEEAEDYYEKKLTKAIISYICSRKRFDPSNPLDYSCQLQSVEQDEHVQRYLQRYNDGFDSPEYALSLEEYIVEDEYLYIDDLNNVSLYRMDALELLEDVSEDSESEEWDEEFEEDCAERKTLLQGSIDFYIRTRRKFDVLDPLRYKVSLKAVSDDSAVKEDLSYLNELFEIPIPLLEFIEECDAFIWDAASQQVSVRYLTPMRERVITTSRGREITINRFFGQFECKACPRQWSSAFSWVDKWQRCKGCEAECYPYQQTDLERGNGTNLKVPHDMDRCEMCILMGELCAPFKFYDARNNEVYESDDGSIFDEY